MNLRQANGVSDEKASGRFRTLSPAQLVALASVGGLSVGLERRSFAGILLNPVSVPLLVGVVAALPLAVQVLAVDSVIGDTAGGICDAVGVDVVGACKGFL